MGLDRYTNERIAQTRLAEDQRLAQMSRVWDRAEEEREGKQSAGSRWFSRLLRTVALGCIPHLSAL